MAKKTEKEQVAPPEVEAPEALLMSFEDFQKETNFHPGIVAGFKYEAGLIEGGLDARPEAEWIQALEEHSKRQY